jgi:PAS domain S-box-containing protein
MVMGGLSSNLGVRLRFPSWPAALIAILVVRAVVSFTAKPGSSLLSYGSISYFLLLLLATGFAIRNGIQNTLGSRSFWVLLAIGYTLWALDQWIFVYHEFGLHTEVPDNSIADPVLFLHIVPFMAAAGTFSTLHVSAPRLYRVLSNFLLLLFFWGFLYVYAVFPYQYLFSNTTTYALRFDILYLVENVALVALLGILSLRVKYPWKMIYLHLLGASALYALSSAVANTAIDSGGYVYGKIYGLGLTASACWFVWVPVRAHQITKAEVRAAQFDTGQGSQASAWAMLVVVVISVPLVWELYQKNETAGISTFRLLVAIAAIVCLASVAFIKEHFAKSELISQLSLANDRLHLAVESGKSVGWEWDLKTGRNSWFGDLQTMFGIQSDTFIGRKDDFYSYVHPEDRQLVAKAIADARQSRKAYAAEFRVVRLDGTVRWVAATGQFYYGTNGDPQRMLGMAADITERRQVEESLRLFRKLIDELNDAIEVVDPKTLRFLDVNDKCCLDLGYTRAELLSLKVSDVDPTVNESFLVGIENELDKSGFVTFESLHRRKDGSTFPVEINLSRVQLDRTYGVNVVRDITERKRVEEALRESEDKLRLILDSTAEAIYGSDREGRCTFCNPACLRVLGYERVDEVLGKDMHHLIHQTRADGTPFPVEECPMIRTMHTGQGVHVDDEVLWRANRTSFPAEYWCYPQWKGQEVVGAVVAFFDITARKLAEAALASVSGKLIEAQEQERTRIARELHDDIGQRLAMLAIQLAQLQQSSSNPSEFLEHIGKLQRQTSEIAADIQSLSHKLHSSRLQYLGLPAALRGLCQEFSEQQEVEVEFETHDMPTSLSSDVSLCFFRVLQEALHNAAKHSGVRRFEVRLWGTQDEIHLMISDSGVGFDIEAAKAGPGFGLISMQERLKLLNGTLSVESQLERGTTIHAAVPLR